MYANIQAQKQATSSRLHFLFTPWIESTKTYQKLPNTSNFPSNPLQLLKSEAIGVWNNFLFQETFCSTAGCYSAHQYAKRTPSKLDLRQKAIFVYEETIV